MISAMWRRQVRTDMTMRVAMDWSVRPSLSSRVMRCFSNPVLALAATAVLTAAMLPTAETAHERHLLLRAVGASVAAEPAPGKRFGSLGTCGSGPGSRHRRPSYSGVVDSLGARTREQIARAMMTATVVRAAAMPVMNASLTPAARAAPWGPRRSAT